MASYKFDRLPPPTIEFLRIVNGVEQARISCQNCGAFAFVELEELGLPETSPFPPEGSIGDCGACGADSVTAEPVYLDSSETKPKVERAQPVENKPTPDEGKSFQSYLRQRLESVTAKLGPSKPRATAAQLDSSGVADRAAL